MTIEDLRTKRVGILGLGVNNWHLAAFLLKQGVALTIRDKSDEVRARFEKEFPEASSLVTWEIRSKILEDIRNFEVLFRSPVIPAAAPELVRARQAGVEVTSQTRLFFQLCPATLIAVTGTKGKGTTVALIHRILQAGYTEGKVYLAGNIGTDPFSFYTQLTEQDIVVLELSSFQCEDLDRSPHIGVLLKVTPDHLNRHRNFEEYLAAKLQLFAHQEEDDIAIVNVENPVISAHLHGVPGRLIRYTRYHPRRQSAWVDTSGGQETLFVQIDQRLESFTLEGRRLLGVHNLENIIPAVLTAVLCGMSAKIIQQEVLAYPGLPHRLSLIGEYEGFQFYDDGSSTVPEACQVALDAFTGKRVHLILGGNDKGGEWKELIETVAARCITVSLLPGSATKKFLPSLKKAVAKHKDRCLILDKAQEPFFPTLLSGLHPHLRKGDIVLLSPAATSFASFKNATDRSEQFILAVENRYKKGESV